MKAAAGSLPAPAPRCGTAPENTTVRVVVVLPAYNAARTLARTVADIPADCVDRIILVDDGSRDATVAIARSLGLEVHCHDRNYGYGRNQKTCYEAALKAGADVIVMLHPDYQYDSRLIPYFLGFIEHGVCDLMLGSRIRTRREALSSGMPPYKYFFNRLLTIISNVVLGQNLGEVHSGFRVYRREVLETIPFQRNGDGFEFDAQLLVQTVAFGFRLGDAPIPVRYMREASSISFIRSVGYGLRFLHCLAEYLLARLGLKRSRLFALQRPR